MFPHLNVTLWGDGNLVRLVRPGKALITPDERCGDAERSGRGWGAEGRAYRYQLDMAGGLSLPSGVGRTSSDTRLAQVELQGGCSVLAASYLPPVEIGR
jgi:hypothetical protein